MPEISADAHRPEVSVTIPAYNAERTIGDAIKSVLAGTYADFEIIVCDDASTDGTPAVVRSFADPRVRLIHNDVNRGEGISRDRAIDDANGRWVAFLDADDMFEPTRLQALVDIAVAHPTSIVFDELMECHDTSNGMRPWRPVRGSDTFPGEPTQARRVTFADWVSKRRTLMQPLIPTELIRTTGARHTTKRFSADLEFILQLIARSQAELWYLPRALYLYRLTPGNMSSVKDRFGLLIETLENAIPLFDGDPSACAALRRKISMVRTTEQYYLFFSHLMHGRIAAAGAAAWRAPWVIPEFIRRSFERVPYHLSRWRHGGKRRNTT